MAVTVKFLSAFQDLTHSKKLFFVEKKDLIKSLMILRSKSLASREN